MSLLGCFKLHHWPAITFGLFLSAFILPYIIAVAKEHVYPLFPYISDSGVLPPEIYVFRQLMNFSALSLGITLYIRYRQVEFAIVSGHIDISKKWNTVALWLIGIICINLSLLANFEETEIFVVHLLTAGLTFATAISYFTVQTLISFRRVQTLNCANCSIRKKTLYFRTFLVLCMYLFSSISFMCGIIAFSEFKGKTIIWWTEEDGSFEVRLASTFSEWIVAISFLLYISTFTYEFKALTFEDFTFTYKNSNCKSESTRINFIDRV